MNKLNQDQIVANLSKFQGWIFENESILKQFQFKDFIEALSFVNAVGLESEKMDHRYDFDDMKIVKEFLEQMSK